jgi:hypothetical protein
MESIHSVFVLRSGTVLGTHGMICRFDLVRALFQINREPSFNKPGVAQNIEIYWSNGMERQLNSVRVTR